MWSWSFFFLQSTLESFLAVSRFLSLSLSLFLVISDAIATVLLCYYTQVLSFRERNNSRTKNLHLQSILGLSQKARFISRGQIRTPQSTDLYRGYLLNYSRVAALRLTGSNSG